jgi:hypothetical protein
MPNEKILLPIIGARIEKITLTMCEYSFGGILVGSVLTKDLPINRLSLILIGISLFIFFLCINVIMSYYNKKNNL